jgi:hypothetical protein
MSTRHVLGVMSVLLGGALTGSFAGEANAGGCWWSGCDAETKPPIVHRTFKKRIQVEQGVYEIARTPSLYGWTVPVGSDAKGASWGGYSEGSRRVLLKPYRNYSIYHRAKHVYTTERVAIQPEPDGEWTWWDRLWLR